MYAHILRRESGSHIGYGNGFGLNLRTGLTAVDLIRSAPGARSISHPRYVDLLQCLFSLPTITSHVLRAVIRNRWLLTFKGVPLSIMACKERSV
jgi:hypothetical protein